MPCFIDEHRYTERKIPNVTDSLEQASLQAMTVYEASSLGEDEAAAVAVFDPTRFESLKEFQLELELAAESPADGSVDPRLAALVREVDRDWPRSSAWTAKPRFWNGLVVLRLRKIRQIGSVSGWLRATATGRGLAVLDLVTDEVLAPVDLQHKFDSASWPIRAAPASDQPDWVRVGALVTHSTFGSGRVLELSTYKRLPVVVVQFEDQVRALDRKHGVAAMRPVVR